jgi:CheY-like chemotaxis protein
VGLGSTFWVELPAVEHAPTPAPDEIPTPSDSGAASVPEAKAARKILYIEDDVANYYLLERFLRMRSDIELLSALQGSIGLDLARAHRPDLILLDLNLPDMTGEQVLRELRNHAVTADTKVVAVTGEVVNDREKELKALGVVETLVKPYKLADVTALLKRTLAAK